MGTIQLFDINMIHRNAELSVRILETTNQGKGIGSTAVNLLVEHAFRDMGLVRVWLRTFSNNQRAIKAYEKVGFIKEGLMRNAAFIDGKILDVVIMARLSDETL